jgi:hypothetical protein
LHASDKTLLRKVGDVGGDDGVDTSNLGVGAHQLDPLGTDLGDPMKENTHRLVENVVTGLAAGVVIQDYVK